MEVYAYALDASGAIQDFLYQSLGLDLAKAPAGLRQAGLKFFGHLDLPPGEYSLRTLVRNGVSGAYSLRVLPLTVPAFGKGPALLPPLFPDRAANRWMLVREAPRGPQVDYPFMARQQPYVPASRPALAARRRGAAGAGRLRPRGRRPQGRAPGSSPPTARRSAPAASASSSARRRPPALRTACWRRSARRRCRRGSTRSPSPSPVAAGASNAGSAPFVVSGAH